MPEGRSPLGILFVHGIGAQRKGETLANFGGALYRWLENAKSRARNSAAIARLTDARLVVPEDPAAPAHARLILNSGLEGASDTEWLLAESWWAESFSAPSFTNLAEWGLGIIPWTIGSHFGAHVRAVWSDRAKPRGLLDRVGWALRFARSILGLVASLFLSLVALAGFAVMLVVALVPIAAVRRWLGGVQRAIAASLGDSYTFVVRPLEGASIVGQVRRDVGWLSTRCDTLVVIAHSQGAAVTFEALRWTRPQNLALLFTFGSGLRKLEELKQMVSRGGRFKRAAALTLLGALFTPIFTIAFFRWVRAGTIDLSDPMLVPMVAGEAVVAVGLFVFGLVDFVNGFGKDMARSAGETLASSGMRWIDCYSTADPVPNGPTFDVKEEMPPEPADQFSLEACNQRSVTADHTSYWSNVDEFVGLVVAALQGVGARGVPASESDREWLAAIRRRRRWRVSILVAIKWAAGIALVASVLRHRADWWNAAEWAVTWGVRWLRELVGLAVPAAAAARPDMGYVIGMCFLIGASYTAGRLAWRRWDAIEQRDLVGHYKPTGGEMALTMAMATQAAVLTGISFEQSTAAIGIAIAVLVGMPVLGAFKAPGLPKSAQPRPADPDRKSATDQVLKFAGGIILPLLMLVVLLQMLRGLVDRLRDLWKTAQPYLPSIPTAVIGGVGVLLAVVLVRWAISARRDNARS